MKKNWREAASVILAAVRQPFVNGCYGKELSKEKPDFQILALKKSSESPIVPGSYVFPGGTVNIADSSNDWIQLFSKFGLCLDTLCNVLNNNNTKLPIFEDTSNCLPRCVSLRITAIREAFEESGTLLCRRFPRTKISNLSDQNSLISFKTEHLKINNIDVWREKVLKNPREFFNLCERNDCYPDIAALYLWSNWLTPSFSPVRFDSVFFIAMLETIHEVVQDNYEIESFKWSTPGGLLNECLSGVSWLPVPQFYELSRLATFSSFLDLSEFSVNLNKMPSELWMPLRIFAKDGDITLLPGDEMYPEVVDYIEPNAIIKENSTLQSFRCHHMHRIEHREKYRNNLKIILSNIKRRSYGHVLPWTPEELRGGI